MNYFIKPYLKLYKYNYYVFGKNFRRKNKRAQHELRCTFFFQKRFSDELASLADDGGGGKKCGLHCVRPKERRALASLNSKTKKNTKPQISPSPEFGFVDFNSQKVFQVYSIFSLWDFQKSVKSVKKVENATF